jgi:predicted Zn-ribbon and HTH transcriptional regulator
MFYCERCGIRFSVGALSGATECPRCKARDGVSQPLRAERLRPIELTRTWQPHSTETANGSTTHSAH